jgi:VanZ family protein
MRRASALTGWRTLLALLVLAACWLAFTPNPPPQIDTGWDKANHFLCFGALAFVALRAFPTGHRRHAAIAQGGLAFGLFIEAVQSRIPGRDAEALDILADSVGLALALLPAYLLRNR